MQQQQQQASACWSRSRMSTEQMAFMVEYTSGVVCLAMEGADLDRLQLPLMVNSEANEEAMYTAFTITADYRHNTTTGISAYDRAITVRQLSNPGCPPADFKRPGHIFPLRYHPGGVLVRPGHTEAGVDLARLAGCYPTGCLSEIVDKRDGSMARLMQLLEFAKQHGLKCITIAQLIRHRLQHEEVVQEVLRAPFRLPVGVWNPEQADFTMHVFRCVLSGQEHLVVSHGGLSGASKVLLHVQRGNVFADLIGGLQSGPSSSLLASLEQLASHSAGLAIYCAGNSASLEGAGKQLASPSATFANSSDGSSVHAARENGIIAAILRKLEVRSVELQSPDDQMRACLIQLGVEVTSTRDRKLFSFKFAAACFAELLGTLIFSFFGGGLVSEDSQEVAWLNGLALAILIYVTANISGGHLNPAVTLPTIITGHTGLFKGCIYIVMQLAGAALGSLLLAGIYPGASVGNKALGVGCFELRQTISTGHLTKGMAFGWEAVMTFTLVATVYSVALGTPNFGNVGPLIIGLVLAASAMLASDKTGAALNPARALGPTFVYQCNWSQIWVYVVAELAGGLVAGIMSWPLYGSGEQYGVIGNSIMKPLRRLFGKPAEGDHVDPNDIDAGAPMESKAV
ncbi:hypothetical protein WJX84_009303 [Apatococcus fuscideae]|uniref:3,4-dihydroxy-2-butanone-4-phosphate synthase n=1 Tax=Apatococcus fuscideae TaxID=2026836 RepID=A0AAW1SKH1_9CHLO